MGLTAILELLDFIIQAPPDIFMLRKQPRVNSFVPRRGGVSDRRRAAAVKLFAFVVTSRNESRNSNHTLQPVIN